VEQNAAFVASGAHVVELVGNTDQTVAILNDEQGSNHLANLTVASTGSRITFGGGEDFSGPFLITGNLNVNTPVELTGAQTVRVLGGLDTATGSNITLTAMETVGGTSAVDGLFSPGLLTVLAGGDSTSLKAGLSYQQVIVEGIVAMAAT